MATTPTQMRLTQADLDVLDAVRRCCDPPMTRTAAVRFALREYQRFRQLPEIERAALLTVAERADARET